METSDQPIKLMPSDVDDYIAAIQKPGFLLMGAKKASLESLFIAAQRGEESPARVLAKILIQTGDREIFETLVGVRHPACVDEICTLWGAEGYPRELGELLEKASWVSSASQPLALQVLTRLRSGRVAGMEELGPAILPTLVDASTHEDENIALRALEWLTHRVPSEWSREICLILLYNSCSPAVQECFRSYRPLLPMHRAWLAWLLEDRAAWQELDKDGVFLSRLASLAPSAVHKALVHQLVSDDRCQLANQTVMMTIGLEPAEWADYIQLLTRTGKFEETRTLRHPPPPGPTPPGLVQETVADVRFLGSARVVCRSDDALLVLDLQGRKVCRIHHPDVHEDSYDQIYSWKETPAWLPSPCGDALITTVTHHGPNNYKDRVKLWEIPSGRLVADVETGLATAMAFSADGKMVATAHYRGERGGPKGVKLCLWSLPGLQELGELDYAPSNAIQKLAFSADGETLLVCGQTILDRIHPHSLKSCPQPLPVNRGNLTISPLPSPNGQRLVVGIGDSLWLQPRPGAPLEALPWTGEQSLAWLDEERLVTAENGPDYSIISIWGLSPGGGLEILRESRRIGKFLAFSPDGSLFAGHTKTGLAIWDCQGGPPLATCCQPETVRRASFAPSGEAVLVADGWRVLPVAR